MNLLAGLAAFVLCIAIYEIAVRPLLFDRGE